MVIDETAVIERVRLVEVSLPLVTPFQISGGTCYCRHSIIVELTSEGVTGFGECAPFDGPFYSSETFSSVKAVLEEFLLPRIIRKKIEGIEHLNFVLTEGIRGNAFARAGIETAYWDLIARKNNVSLRELIRWYMAKLETPAKYLKTREYIESGVSVGIPVDQNYSTLCKWIERYMQEGYRRIKIKIKPGWDLEAVRVARSVVGRDFPFWVDANASFDLKEHLYIFQKMDEYNCLFYEQPLHYDDLLDHAVLARKVKTPICLDESLKSYRYGRQALEINAAKVWNIKIQRLGGLLEAIKLYKLAVENDIGLWAGTMPETGIGTMPIICLGSFEGFIFPSDVEASKRWYGKGQDLIEIEITEDGKIGVPEGIGIGSINFENYRRYGRTLLEV